MKAIEKKHLNPVRLLKEPEYCQGFLDACNLLNDMYSAVTMNAHPNMLGDCLLAKVNLLKKGRRIRKNPWWIKREEGPNPLFGPRSIGIKTEPDAFPVRPR